MTWLYVLAAVAAVAQLMFNVWQTELMRKEHRARLADEKRMTEDEARMTKTEKQMRHAKHHNRSRALRRQVLCVPYRLALNPLPFPRRPCG